MMHFSQQLNIAGSIQQQRWYLLILFQVLAKVAESIGSGGGGGWGSKEWVTVGVPLIMCYPDVDLLIKNVFPERGDNEVSTSFETHEHV